MASIAHGRSKEKLARCIYASRMQGKIKKCLCLMLGLLFILPFLIFEPALMAVFNPSISPQYGLLEVKCPFKQCAKTIEEALADPDVYLLF